MYYISNSAVVAERNELTWLDERERERKISYFMCVVKTKTNSTNRVHE